MEWQMLQRGHGDMRWLLFLVGVIVIGRFLYGWLQNGNFSVWDSRLMTILAIIVRIQFVLGLILIIWKGVSVADEVAWGRVLAHAVTMFIAVGVVEMASVSVKKTVGDQAKFEAGAKRVILAAILIVIGITLTPAGW